MRRLYVTVTILLLCSIAFAQHPHSRGGNPLYWAIVGGLGALITYLLYLSFGWLIKLINHTNKGNESHHNNKEITQKDLSGNLVNDVSEEGIKSKSRCSRIIGFIKSEWLFIILFVVGFVGICVSVNLYVDNEVDESRRDINRSLSLIYGKNEGVCHFKKSGYTIVSYKLSEIPHIGDKDSSIYIQMYGNIKGYYVAKNKPWNIRQYIYEDGLLRAYMINPYAVGLYSISGSPEKSFKTLYDYIIDGYNVTDGEVLEPANVKSNYHYMQEYSNDMETEIRWYDYYSDKLFFTRNCYAFYRIVEDTNKSQLHRYLSIVVFTILESILFFLALYLKKKSRKGGFTFTKRIKEIIMHINKKQSFISDPKQYSSNNSVTEMEYDVLLHKINPLNFMNPYDAEKVKLANDLYSALLKSKDNETLIHMIEEKAKNDLKI